MNSETDLIPKGERVLKGLTTEVSWKVLHDRNSSQKHYLRIWNSLRPEKRSFEFVLGKPLCQTPITRPLFLHWSASFVGNASSKFCTTGCWIWNNKYSPGIFSLWTCKTSKNTGKSTDRNWWTFSRSGAICYCDTLHNMKHFQKDQETYLVLLLIYIYGSWNRYSINYQIEKGLIRN